MPALSANYIRAIVRSRLGLIFALGLIICVRHLFNESFSARRGRNAPSAKLLGQDSEAASRSVFGPIPPALSRRLRESAEAVFNSGELQKKGEEGSALSTSASSSFPSSRGFSTEVPPGQDFFVRYTLLQTGTEFPQRFCDELVQSARSADKYLFPALRARGMRPSVLVYVDDGTAAKVEKNFRGALSEKTLLHLVHTRDFGMSDVERATIERSIGGGKAAGEGNLQNLLMKNLAALTRMVADAQLKWSSARLFLDTDVLFRTEPSDLLAKMFPEWSGGAAVGSGGGPNVVGGKEQGQGLILQKKDQDAPEEVLDAQRKHLLALKSRIYAMSDLQTFNGGYYRIREYNGPQCPGLVTGFVYVPPGTVMTRAGAAEALAAYFKVAPAKKDTFDPPASRDIGYHAVEQFSVMLWLGK